MTEKGEFIWRNCPSWEADLFIDQYVSRIQEVEGVVAITASLQRNTNEPDSLFITTWVEVPFDRNEEDIYSVEYDALENLTAELYVEFSLRESIPELADMVRKWAGLACIWFKK